MNEYKNRFNWTSNTIRMDQYYKSLVIQTMKPHSAWIYENISHLLNTAGSAENNQ